MAWILAAETALEVAGEPRAYESSPGTIRYFCGRCGTGLFYRNGEIFPGQVDIQLATLDEPGTIEVTEQVQAADRMRWMERLGELPSHPRYPGHEPEK